MQKRQDETTVREARKVIEGIVRHQKNSADRLSGFEKQVEDLKLSVRLLNESTYRAAPESMGDERHLQSFVRKDGSLRLFTEKALHDVPNHGSVQVEEKGLLDASTPANEWHRELLDLHQQRSVARLMMREPNTPKLNLKIHKHLGYAPANIKPAVQKAIYDGAGVGAEWIPDQFRAELYEEFQVPRGLRALMPEIQMERNTLLVPVLDRGGRPYIKGTVTSDTPASYTASSIATAQRSISMAGLACRFVIDDAISEDSAIALVPALQRQISQDLEDAFEDAMINGDTTATHEDAIANWNIRERWGATGLGGSADHRRAFKGLRRQSFDRGTTENLSTFTNLSHFLGLVKKLGEHSASDKLCIASPEVVIAQLLDLDEVVTLDKFGPAATVLTGQIGSLAGIPIVMSRFLSADLHTDGKYTGSGSTSGLLVVNPSSYSVFMKRGILVERDKDITAGAINLVSTMRATFDTLDGATVKNVAYGFNMSV
jgi:hypothetical protein